MDEPTASLDAIATEQIKNSLDAIKENRTVVIISHSLSQILDSDKIYVMKKAALLKVELMSNSMNKKVFTKKFLMPQQEALICTD